MQLVVRGVVVVVDDLAVRVEAAIQLRNQVLEEDAATLGRLGRLSVIGGDYQQAAAAAGLLDRKSVVWG